MLINYKKMMVVISLELYKVIFPVKLEVAARNKVSGSKVVGWRYKKQVVIDS